MGLVSLPESLCSTDSLCSGSRKQSPPEEEAQSLLWMSEVSLLLGLGSKAVYRGGGPRLLGVPFWKETRLCSATRFVYDLLRPHFLHPMTDSCPCLLGLEPEPHLVFSRPSRGTVEKLEPGLHLTGQQQQQRRAWSAPGPAQQQ